MKGPDQHQGSPSFLFSGYWGSFPENEVTMAHCLRLISS